MEYQKILEKFENILENEQRLMIIKECKNEMIVFYIKDYGDSYKITKWYSSKDPKLVPKRKKVYLLKPGTEIDKFLEERAKRGYEIYTIAKMIQYGE